MASSGTGGVLLVLLIATILPHRMSTDCATNNGGMRATVLHAPGDVRVEDVPDPTLHQPTDAIVRVVAACVCGSDLWPYRGISPATEPRRIGHEFVGVVEEVGSQVSTVRTGDFVIAPFKYSDNTCAHCTAGVQSACVDGGIWGTTGRDGVLVDGGQGQFVRVPLADGTLVSTPHPQDDAMTASFLSLSDVMGTGWHAARAARVSAGDTVVVVGDGAVGLSGVLAAARMGAERIVAMSRHAPRQAIAREFGATHVVAERGEEGVAAVMELTDGVGADAVLECVGTAGAMQQAFDSARPGAMVGFVGVPHDIEVPIGQMFSKNVGLAGGVAPVREYLPELRDLVLEGAIDPGRVFDLTLGLDDVARAYTEMDERRAIKSLLRM